LTNWIDYPDLEFSEGPFSRLFVDYVTDYQKVRQFYGGNPQDAHDWRRLLEQVCARTIDRSILTKILSRQNRDFHCGVKSLANIDLLRDDNCVAVVTGQQVGLFTGPLYTIYKAITTVKLADKLGKDFPDHKFVPVFWLAGEDHDFEEVSSVSLFNAAGELVRLDYKTEGKESEANHGAVGEIELDESIETMFKSAEDALLPTEFKPRVLELFKTAYQKGMTFNKAFVHLMNVLLEDSGLIFLNSNDSEIKQVLLPVFRRELAETPRSCQLVIDQSAILERQYHAQVKPRSINLFLFHEKGRYPIEPHPNGYFLKGTRQHFTKAELDALLNEQPQMFSPNVVLRPICQDTLLPTVAYVAGPSELAYFGQYNTLYKELGIPQPMIYPRASVTVVEERVDKVLTRYSLEPLALFGNLEFLKQQIAEQISDLKAEDFFATASHSIDESLNELKPALQSIDPTLLPAMGHTLEKIHSHLNGLKEKTIAAQKRQHEVSLRQIDKAAANLFPSSNFQERQLNILYFLNKYGLEFVRWLFREIQIDKLKHQLLRI
jgi:bacillithiol biosynthesis cysteine-adding enzyme BshC